MIASKRGRLLLYTLDSSMTEGWITVSWFLAAWGIAVFQVMLLIQSWMWYQSATVTACLASMWILGSVFGQRLTYALRRATLPSLIPLWGTLFLSMALGWLWWQAGTWSTSLTRPTTTIALATMAVLMGMLSTCWLAQRRPWPAIQERIQLARGLTCLTLALVLVWMFSVEAGFIGLALLLPLLCIDLIPARRSPFPTRGGKIDELLERSASNPATWFPLVLSHGGSWWWISYLARCRYLFPTMLNTGLTIATGAIWLSVTTPFAAHLASLHQTQTLIWLIFGQLCALGLGGYIFTRSRNVVGLPDRPIPPVWQQRCWYLALVCLLLIALSLIALGAPFFQAPWWLALKIGVYTFAGATWGILLPRLRPNIRTKRFVWRHFLAHEGNAISSGRLAYEQALEAQAFQCLSTWEGLLTAIITPFCGLFIDYRTCDEMLMIGGTLFFLFVIGMSAYFLLIRRLASPSHQKKHAQVSLALP